MNYTDILKIAEATAVRLGIRIKDSDLILQNMKPKPGIVTILYSDDFTLWVDKHYIAYGDNSKPEIVYVFTDEVHAHEELRSVDVMMRYAKSTYQWKTLASVKEQLQTAAASMKKYGNGLYFFEEMPIIQTEETEVKGKSDERTLCYKCKSDYENTGEYYIRRTAYKQTEKKLCMFCSVRYGYDYELSPKRRKEGRR